MIMKELPKYYDTFVPILEILCDGKTIAFGEMLIRVRDEYYSDLSSELLAQKTKSGKSLILDRITWGKVYLKQAKMLEQPERGMVKITEKGLRALESGNLTIESVLNDHDFVAHEKKQRMKSDVSDGVRTSATPQDLIDTGIQEIEEQTKGDLLERLKGVNPYYFERVVLELFKKMGYGDFQETAKSGDGGIDGIINQDQLGMDKIYVQAKRYSDNKVRETDIRNFIGAMAGDTLKGIFVTTSEFDNKAVLKAHDAHHKIILIDGLHLVELMYKYGVGVQTKNTYELKEIDEDFFVTD